MPIEDDGFYSWDKESHYIETWHAMEALVDEGKCKYAENVCRYLETFCQCDAIFYRTIGLSNFNLTQIREVMNKAKKYLPSVLQNESHPYLQEKDLRDFCRIHGIVFQVSRFHSG